MRVGNDYYADYSNSIFPDQYRVVHNCDFVPHWPFAYQGYVHAGYEMFEDIEGNVKQCELGEDANCSNRFAKGGMLNWEDHYTYLGVEIFGEDDNDSSDEEN